MFARPFVLGCLIAALLPDALSAQQMAQAAVDTAFDQIAQNVGQQGLTVVASIDHARLAEAEGVQMPASRVLIFSDPTTNTAILSSVLRAGLDLPFRALAYDDDGKTAVVYTGADFLGARHGVTDAGVLDGFDRTVSHAVAGLTDAAVRPAPTEGLTTDYGVVELQSAYDFRTTVERLKAVIAAQSDTIWFGSVDFSADANALGVDLLPATILLFGGPKPGGVAMAEFPAIGLDAFCQKLFIFEDDDGEVFVLFNDIEALARLHYGRSIPPHAILNQRLVSGFADAIK
ncbi:MAG: DUF302 domain-containing protein [Bauldia sp.]|nr:DUF302 domain-containing protein [Bauldia sp.]